MLKLSMFKDLYIYVWILVNKEWRGRCDFERENVELATPSVILWPIVHVEKA